MTQNTSVQAEGPKCGARKPGWENGPAIGRHRIPCVRPKGHQGVHRDGLRQEWPQQPESPTVVTARRILAEADSLDFSDVHAMATAVGPLREALRTVLEHIGKEGS